MGLQAARITLSGVGVLVGLFTSTALLGACSSGPDESADDVGVSVTSGSLTRAFDTSASAAGVPRDLLVAIAKVEEGLDIPAERLAIDVDNEVPAAGPLQLRRGKLDTLARGAELVARAEVDLRMHADLALHAGALVLAELGQKTGARGGDLASWSAAIEEMSGFADDAHRRNYAHQVFATLARGGRFEGRDGEIIVLGRHDLPPSLTLDVSSSIRPLDGKSEYPAAEWIPTSCNNKCTPGRSGASVQFIVIHDTEGGWNASVATLQNDPQKSVQYIVGTDGRVGQFVVENTTAWHAGNLYYNQRSVGIEHVGYATKPYTEPEYAASAKLVDYLATKYKVARDRAHIIGHDQIPNGNRIAASSPPCPDSPKTCTSGSKYGGASVHSDPGIWEWPTFMVRFDGHSKCNDVTPIWNCSYDKKKAFRCANDKVEVETCDGAGGCEVKESGVDDVCHIGPRNAPTPVGEEPPTTTSPEAPPGTRAPMNPSEGEAPAAEAESGCSAAPASRAPGRWGSPLLLVSAIGALALVRRRRSRG